MTAPQPPDPDAVARFALRVWQYKQGEVVSLMVHLGDRLGLYRALDGAGWMSAPDLAAGTGLHERWVREWLLGQGAAGLLDVDTDDDGSATRFRLGPEGALVLAREDDSLVFAAGAFSGAVAPPDVVDALADAFRTGRGLTYDQLGPGAAHSTERMLAPWARLALVPVLIPALQGVATKLRTGALVADVGCGSGVALLALARTFPASRFAGYDLSRHAIDRASVVAGTEGLTNVTFSVAAGEDLPPEPVHDLVLTFDCLHDMTHPDVVAGAIRLALRPGGTWLIREIRSAGRWADDVRNPVLALQYGFSVATCMSSALSEPGGAGLGTLGLPSARLEELVRAAGFDSIVVHDIDDPANLYYEVRATG